MKIVFDEGGTRYYSCKIKMPEDFFENILNKKIKLKDIPKIQKINNHRIYLYAVYATSDDCNELTETLKTIFLDSQDGFPTLSKDKIKEFKDFITSFLKAEIISANKKYKHNPIFIKFLETLPFEYRKCVDEKINYQITPIPPKKTYKKIQISLSPEVYDKLTQIKQYNNFSYSETINGILDDVIE